LSDPSDTQPDFSAGPVATIAAQPFSSVIDATLFFSGCSRTYDIASIAPPQSAYGPYDHALTDALESVDAVDTEASKNVPLEFDVPGSAITGVIGPLALDSMATCDSAANVCHISIPAAQMAITQTPILFQTNARELTKSYTVCFTRTPLRQHDNMSSAAIGQAVLSLGASQLGAVIDNHPFTSLAAAAIVPGIPGLGALAVDEAAHVVENGLLAAGLATAFCSNDFHDELVMFVAANSHTMLYSG